MRWLKRGVPSASSCLGILTASASNIAGCIYHRGRSRRFRSPVKVEVQPPPVRWKAVLCARPTQPLLTARFHHPVRWDAMSRAAPSASARMPVRRARSTRQHPCLAAEAKRVEPRGSRHAPATALDRTVSPRVRCSSIALGGARRGTLRPAQSPSGRKYCASHHRAISPTASAEHCTPAWTSDPGLNRAVGLRAGDLQPVGKSVVRAQPLQRRPTPAGAAATRRERVGARAHQVELHRGCAAAPGASRGPELLPLVANRAS